MRKHALAVGLLVVVGLVLGLWSSLHAAGVESKILYQKKVSLTYPKTYTFKFSLWDADTDDPAGIEVWSEEKDIKLKSATLKTYLGEIEPLGEVDFSQQLYVQVERFITARNDYVVVGPREAFKVVPYAMWSATSSGGGTINQVIAGEGLTSEVVGDQVTLNVGEGAGISVTADSVTIATGGVTTGMLSDGAVTDAKIAGPISVSKIPHAHSGADITSGTVADARIDAAIARDSEIVPAVLAADGSGSGLDADRLDGLDSTAFAAGVHAHSGADITSGTVADARIDGAIARDTEIMPTVLANDGVGSNLNADLLDGLNSDAFATAAHNHTGSYVAVAGDTMTGALVLDTDTGENLSISEDTIGRNGDLAINVFNDAANTTVSIVNPDPTFNARLDVEGTAVIHGNVSVGTDLHVFGEAGINHITCHSLGVTTSFTPSSSADPTGLAGDISWDEDYIYVKTTSGGWKRAALSTF